MSSTVTEAIEAGHLGGRLWLYSNYHCNLTCDYCLTESGPGVPRRILDRDAMLERAREAKALGFTELGLTGGEPFILDYMPELLVELSQILPVLVLSNATLFTGRRLEALDVLAGHPIAIQISLDSAEPQVNDEMRGPKNFARVIEAIPELIRRGIEVRIATTLDDPDSHDPAELERLCVLHRGLGVPDEHHVVRPVIKRGRAVDNGMGIDAGFGDISAELCVTADGAFATPFGPTVRGGRLDTDLLVTRTTAPLSVPAERLAAIAGGRPGGHDARLGIR